VDENVTRLIVIVSWNGGDEPYYPPRERVAVLEDWITNALADRDDSPSVVSFGEITQ